MGRNLIYETKFREAHYGMSLRAKRGNLVYDLSITVYGKLRYALCVSFVLFVVIPPDSYRDCARCGYFPCYQL